MDLDSDGLGPDGEIDAELDADGVDEALAPAADGDAEAEMLADNVLEGDALCDKLAVADGLRLSDGPVPAHHPPTQKPTAQTPVPQ